MKTMNVIDSSCWIEFFMGNEPGKFVRELAKEESSLIVPTIALLEVHKFLSRHTTDSEQLAFCIAEMQRGQVIDLNSKRAIAASLTAQTHKLAMADAIMYSIAQEFNATFWTQDVDYKGLPNVQYQAKMSI